jgi:shikimate kinase
MCQKVGNVNEISALTRKNIVLTGFMGTGKTTVGRQLSARLAYSFVDTDDLIAARDGRSIAEIFRQAGEAAFRRWESSISPELAGQQGLVIATGGRLMLDPSNARALGHNAHVFCLTAAPQEIVARLLNDGGVRPLLDVPDPAGQVQALLAQRAKKYGQFQQIQTDGKSIEEVTEEIVKCISVK